MAMLDDLDFTLSDNSCGAVALEYPEYMIKGPSSVSAAYLEGDIVSFSCSQDHISMGDTEYQCEFYNGRCDFI
uniref:Sushi domain-containing protein n=1 Tax=Parascaris equorum TaxID=6256 RepID=A0A914RDX5_PAREQ